MALYALDDVDDAYHITRAFLTSIGRTTWFKLAFIVLFVGAAGASFPGANFSGDGSETDPGAPPVDELRPLDIGPDLWLLAGVVLVAVFAVVLALLFVAAVMEFVFVESLRTEVVSIREYWGRHWRKGAHLFAFRLVVGLFLLAPFAVLSVLMLVSGSFDPTAFGAPLVLLLALAPVFVVLAIVVGLVDGFTTNFVVPIMILEDVGVLEGWRRLWPTIRAEWKQYLAYAIAAWVLSLVGGVAVGIVTALVAVVLLVPFGVLIAVGIGLFVVFAPVGIAWLAVTGLLFGLAVVVVAALVQVPVQTYLRYYALLVLGDVEETFDIVPQQRTLVRSDVEEAP